MKSKFHILLMLLLSLYITQAKAGLSSYLAQVETNEKNYLKGFYITFGLSESLNNTKTKLEPDIGYNEVRYIPSTIQSSNHLLNLGMGYEVNKFFAVEFNYKQGLLRGYNSELKARVYNILNKNYSNKSDNYIVYLVGKLPSPTKYITQFIKFGLGYSEYKTKQFGFYINREYDWDNSKYDVCVISEKLKIKMDGISYHMQIGADINLNQQNAFSIFWGFDYMSGKPIQSIEHYDSINRPFYSKKRIKQNVLNKFIGINYIYKF